MVADPDGYSYRMVTNDGWLMTFQENFYAPSPGRPNTYAAVRRSPPPTPPREVGVTRPAGPQSPPASPKPSNDAIFRSLRAIAWACKQPFRGRADVVVRPGTSPFWPSRPVDDG